MLGPLLHLNPVTQTVPLPILLLPLSLLPILLSTSPLESARLIPSTPSSFISPNTSPISSPCVSISKEIAKELSTPSNGLPAPSLSQTVYSSTPLDSTTPTTPPSVRNAPINPTVPAAPLSVRHDHTPTIITLKNSLNQSNSNFPKRKIPISILLFRKSDVQDGINLCSKRFSEQFKNEPIKAIDSFRYHTFCLLRDLSIDQAKQNKKLINEIKDLSYKNQSPSKEASERLNEIITERILSSRERFYKFIAQSRHSPSKAMTLMSSESSISKRPRVEDADIHLKFWIDHFKNVDTYDHTPKEHKQNIEFFLNYVKSDGNILSNEASTSLSILRVFYV